MSLIEIESSSDPSASVKFVDDDDEQSGRPGWLAAPIPLWLFNLPSIGVM